MILQALHDYYRRLLDENRAVAQGFQEKEIPFVIVLDAKGTFVDLEDTRSGEGRNRRARRFIVPDRPRILVDGIDLEPYLGGAVREAPPPAPRRQDPPRFYICPNDEATLRVRPGTPEGKYKCPLDGAVMRSGVGPGRQYWLLE